MTFSPIIPQTGLQGWLFLSRTIENQKEAFSQSNQNSRDVNQFKEKISDIKTAEQLVNNREMLKVALGAFGLDDDIDNKFLIKTVLEEGSLDENSLANKFTDKRYLSLSKAFGFGDFDTPRTQLSDFPDEILEAYQVRSFEAAVGDIDETQRLALSLDRELLDIAEGTSSDTTKWLSLLGSIPLTSVFKTAFNLPDAFGNLSLDKQVETIKDKMESYIGESDFSAFEDETVRDKLRNKFLLASEIASWEMSSSGSIALSLLQSNATLRF